MSVSDLSTISTAITSLGMSVVFCFLFWKFITNYLTEEAKTTQAALKGLEIAITKLTDKLDTHLSDDKESKNDIR